ncbi:MAG: hypothetical protein M1834_007444 [Cirrosporium novae-zelandiae]|nr:MAG: hypothetical protein M1834_007444 [Cirrosporium novae-zelandiae]
MAGGYRQINKSLNACAFEDYLSTQQAYLPSLAIVENVSPRVVRVLGGNPGKFTLQGTNTYLVGTGPSRLLIDTGQGIPVWSQTIADYLAAENIEISHVLCTHWHGDHTGGIPDLISLYPSLSSSIYKCHPDKGQLPIYDGQTFTVEGATVTALFTPGHSHDHMCFVLQEENAMFTGDNVLGHGTTAVEDLGTFMSTLQVMLARDCILGYPAHGDVIPKLKLKISEYLGQRLRRERQVLLALKKLKKANSGGGGRSRGSATVRELAIAVHGEGMDESLYELVLEPFMGEVLSKLAEDGKVGFELSRTGKKWYLNEFNQ